MVRHRAIALRVGAVMVLATTLAVGTSVRVVADDWPLPGYHPDGGKHSYCYAANHNSDIEANAFAAMSHALDYHTEAEREYDEPCDTTGHPQTDVRWDNGDLPGYRGLTECAIYAPSTGYCDRFQVTLDLAELNQGDHDEADQDKTACHEVGHSVGLRHHDDGGDCMVTGERPSLDEKWEHYSPHHEDHIDNWF